MLGIDTVARIDDLPDGPWDLVFVCTPAGREPRPAARVRAPRRARRVPHERGLRRGGRRRARAAEHELVALADELGILLAGPNGQGVVSTPARCARRSSRPYPPRGPDRDREPVGQLRVVVRELGGADRRRREPRGVSAGNAAAVGVADYLDWYADDAATAVSLAYVEGVADGRALFERLARGRRGASRSCW